MSKGKAARRRELESSARAANAPREAVFVALWNDPKYVELHERKDRAGRAWNEADARKESDAPKRLRAFESAIGAITSYEREAFEAAGLPF